MRGGRARGRRPRRKVERRKVERRVSAESTAGAGCEERKELTSVIDAVARHGDEVLSLTKKVDNLVPARERGGQSPSRRKFRQLALDAATAMEEGQLRRTCARGRPRRTHRQPRGSPSSRCPTCRRRADAPSRRRGRPSRAGGRSPWQSVRVLESALPRTTTRGPCAGVSATVEVGGRGAREEDAQRRRRP